VERVAFPADGRTRFGDWLMPLAWDASAATLDLVGPRARRLASYRHCPQSLVMWSAPTPSGGMEGELVVLNGGTPAEVERTDVNRRIVFTPGHPTEIKALVADRGGLGLVSDWMRASGLPAERHWVNTWSDSPGGWAMQAHDRRLWSFMLSPDEGRALRAAAVAGPLRLRARVDTRLYAGELHHVTGLLAGVAAEEVLLTAHINEQGANDNAAGAAVALETARLLAALLDHGVLPPLRRGIRFLLMPESYGTIAYAATYPERLARTRAALNLDTGAGDYDSDDAVLDVILNPRCCPNLADGALVALVRAWYHRQGAPERWRLKPYMLAGDNFLGEPRIGVPHPWLWMGDGGDFWHNTADTPERVDPRSLRDLVALAAAYAYLMAQAEPVELAAIAGAARAALAPDRQPLLRLPGDPAPAPVPGALPDDDWVPDRERIGALTLDGVPPDRWGPIAASPRWWGAHLAAWWWVDGHRSLAEIAARIRDELGVSPEDLTEFFAQLEILGYLRRRPAAGPS
jgi:hypothetical protein